MSNPYRSALATPGAPAFVVAGLLARLPLSMNGIGLVLLVQAATGSYGLAGAVAAAYSVAQAVSAPVLSRLVDRHGQARVIRPAVVVHAAALVAVVAAAPAGAPVLAVGALAVVAGASFASYGSLVRARWVWALRERPPGQRRGAGGLHTAFSLESVLDEVVFTVGPLLVTLLAVAVSPTVALLAGLVAQVTGALALALQRRTEPGRAARAAASGPPVTATTPGAVPAEPHASAAQSAGRRTLGVLVVPGILALVASFVGVGVVFGSVEILAVAFTAERGAPAAAGVVLALYAVGSLFAGLAFGALSWRGSLPKRFRATAVLVAVLCVPVAFADSVPLLAAALLLAGVAISPTLICGNALVQELVRPAQLTEGLAWVGTSLGLGVSLGAALSGRLIDAVGAQQALVLPVAAAGAAALVVVACSRPLGAGRSPAPGSA